MGVSLPSADVAIIVNSYLRGRGILSGDAAVDLGYGWRGISSQANHVWCFKTHEIACLGAPDAETTEFFSTANVAYQTVTRTGRYESGANVVAWYVAADMERGTIQLVTSRGSATVIAAARSRQYAAVALGATTKGEVTWLLNFKATATHTGKIYRATVCELRLVVGNIT